MDLGAHELDGVIYLDNAATVFPKPPVILERALALYARYGVNPGRSGYDLCHVAGDLVHDARVKTTKFFGGSDPDRLCFANNCSDALNILIPGLVRRGDHVVSTVLEHNSVLRPLHHLRKDGVITFDLVGCGNDCRVDPDDVRRAITPRTRLVIVNHASNVVGAIQPIAAIGAICREAGVLFLVDTAQTAGIQPIEVAAFGIDALAFTGHKSLLAPTGIGGLYVAPGVVVEPTRFGGTGVRSAEPLHLEEYPYRLEVGTPNVLGIFALASALDYIAEQGMSAIYEHEMAIFSRIEEGLAELPGVVLHGPRGRAERLPVLSATVAGLDPADVGTMLDVDHGIACRTGLQCAPLVHERLGTAPRGTVRLAVGPESRMEHADRAVRAFAAITQAVRR